MIKHDFLGEFLGTFLLVFFGCSTVASAVLLSSFNSLYEVASLWGAGLAIAITVSAKLSGAHLNPAMSIAFACFTDFSWRKVPSYIIAQLLGAFVAGYLVFSLFEPSIISFEQLNGLVRGGAGSERSAMILAEFYPNPSNTLNGSEFTLKHALIAEFLGTALLSFVIFSLISLQPSQLPAWMLPLLIGITLTVLISIFAPISQAGFNPARDLMPRIILMLKGWGDYPFTALGSGWLTVYIIAPIMGAITGGGLERLCSKTLIRKDVFS